MFNLAAVLPQLIPKAVAWAESESAAALRIGSALSPARVKVAQAVGVRHPEQIRLVESAPPYPTDPELQIAAAQTGLLGPHMAGLTLGYAVFVCAGKGTCRLLSHEFRHVHQYELAGGIAAFLPIYLGQIATVGYENAPLEIDARAHERDAV